MYMHNNMNKIKIIKREYLGEGYYHDFRNETTKERLIQYISKEEYEKMSGVGGWRNNPIPPEGFKWYCSAGGSIKVDTQDGMLALNDYTQIGDKYFVCELNHFGEETIKEYTEEEFNNLWQ